MPTSSPVVWQPGSHGKGLITFIADATPEDLYLFAAPDGPLGGPGVAELCDHIGADRSRTGVIRIEHDAAVQGGGGDVFYVDPDYYTPSDVEALIEWVTTREPRLSHRARL